MFCRQCGKELKDDSAFCPYCGIKRKEEKQQKSKEKNMRKRVIVVIAVLLVAAIILSILFIRHNMQLEEMTQAEEKLTQLLKESTDKPIVEFVYEDYDADGTYEAYAVAGKTAGAADGEKTEYYEADVFFVNDSGAQIIQESVSGKLNGVLDSNGKIYISLENITEDKTESYSYIYTVEESNPVESETSGKYHEVHQEDGKILAKEDINADFVEIEISDKVNEIKNPDNNEEQKEKIHAEYQTLMRDFYNDPQKYLKLNNPSDISIENDTFAIADVNEDGIDELILSSTSGIVGEWKTIIWSYDTQKESVYEYNVVYPYEVEFYENNIMLSKYGYNRTNGDMYPFEIYEFNKAENKYVVIFLVYNSVKEYCEAMNEDFPEEYDKDNDGVVYCFSKVNENYEVEYADNNEYERRIAEYISDDKRINIEYKKITSGNIENITKSQS
ncbi:MAG: zinc ribbon domain-containing protein [Clostridia bacterium]|nr:zinc ribbon domain-containing protein [Clostridia bacterium]